ncbi:MAG: hypothetical protein KC492_21430, partial [Myxococcales bacterium]|nr:hypothetical protein [Myxococcales bacterium]
PTLARARGKVLFFINDRADFARAYSRDFTTTAGRLMFAESQPGEDIEAVRILNGALSDFSEIQQAVKDGFIVRTRDGGLDAAQDPAEFESALKSGAQIISTDFPVKVDGVDYVMEIPGGTPARCNPLNAPTDCTSADIESRERLR